jgi:hypothetical protein
MKRAEIAFCLFLALLPPGCSKGTTPPPGPTTSGKNCDTDGLVLDWAGGTICAEQLDTNHYTQTAVQVHSRKCGGIHITHSKDMILYLEVHKENAANSCPANPFQKDFPFDSGPNHIRDFKTGMVKDPKGTAGCEYEMKIHEKSSGVKCDPHIALLDQ